MSWHGHLQDNVSRLSEAYCTSLRETKAVSKTKAEFNQQLWTGLDQKENFTKKLAQQDDNN